MKCEEPVIGEPRDAEVLIIAVDCGKYAAENQEKFSQLRNVATRMARHRLLYGESVHDLVGVFKLGSTETRNRLADDNPGGYGGIERVFPAARRSLEAVRAVRDLQPDGQNVLLLDVLEAIGDYLHGFEGTAAKRKRVVLFTHSNVAGSKPSESEIAELIETCVLYRDALVQVDVICADWVESAEIDDFDEDEDNKNYGDMGNVSRVIRPTSYFFERAAKFGAPAIWAFARATGGILLSAEEASDEVDRPKASSKRPVARFRATLDIGKEVKIPVKAYYVVTETKKVSATKLSWAASRGARAPVGVHVETLRVAAATDKDPLELEQILSAYSYGTDLVPTQMEAEEAWGHKVPCGISTIAFIARSRVPARWFMSRVSAVIPMPGVPPAHRALHALVQALHTEDKGILARTVTTQRGGAPTMAFLWPVIETSSDSGRVLSRFLYMVELPLREDVRNYPFASLRDTRSGLPVEAVRAMDAFIDCRRLDSAPLPAVKEEDVMVRDDACEEEQLDLDPPEQCNPALDRFYCAVIQRALDGPEATGLPAPSNWQKQLMDPKTFLAPGSEAKVEETLKNLKIALPVAKVPVKEREKKRVSDVLNGEVASITDFLPPALGEVGEDVATNMDELDGDVSYLGEGGGW